MNDKKVNTIDDFKVGDTVILIDNDEGAIHIPINTKVKIKDIGCTFFTVLYKNNNNILQMVEVHNIKKL